MAPYRTGPEPLEPLPRRPRRPPPFTAEASAVTREEGARIRLEGTRGGRRMRHRLTPGPSPDRHRAAVLEAFPDALEVREARPAAGSPSGARAWRVLLTPGGWPGAAEHAAHLARLEQARAHREPDAGNA